MANFNFTVAGIAALLKALPKHETTHGDTAVPGLCLRLRPTGAAFFVRYRTSGRGSPQRRFTIGKLGAVGLAEARKIATQVLAEVRSGGDPAAAKRAKAKPSGGTTLADLTARHVADLRARGVVATGRTAVELRRDFLDQIGGERDPRTVTRTELIEIIERVRDGVPGHQPPRPGSAQTLRSKIHGLFEHAVSRGVVTANPLAGWKRPPLSRAERLEQAEKRAGRMLGMEEIAALWTACDDPRIRPAWGAFVRSLLILGSRRTETSLARWAWISPATANGPAIITVPATATKAGRQHALPLPSLALNVIASVPRFADSDLLFPVARSRRTGRTAVISGFSTGWSVLLKVARDYGLTGHLRIHDLRKTARSHWSRLGIQDRVAEALLNHAPTDVLIGIYDRRDLMAEKIDALTRWCGEIEAALERREETARASPGSADVVPLHKPQKARRQRPAASARAS